VARRAGPEQKAQKADDARRYRERHLDRVREAQRRWREAHPGWWRKYAGTERERRQRAEWHATHREERQARRRERYAANPAKFIEAARRYQVKVVAATVERVDYAAIIVRDRGLCGICGDAVPPEEMSFDHIVPVSRGGDHSMANVQLAHLVCNKRKGNRRPADLEAIVRILGGRSL